ncbi:PHB depolymerase family esterase [Bosea sp. BK604]|uniref:extracellular catalytic domain type 1 short-chain-length polyhydroxyalkanoate depolymerase n=1 Tax=Bosea sp. BK604 TaxID=2512180 RepID=UPI001044648B|nr:PHB depolymerase family esterase [Bosea sp. BK604]TCR63458.1 poly(hydroxyalkanoate) depolymerase family esterase [Bosea sp. BK604]
MTPFIRNTLGDAMSRLKSSDVAGATAAIQRGLAGRALMSTQPPTRSDIASGPFDRPRRLGEILKALKDNRAQFAPGATTSKDHVSFEGGRNSNARIFRNAAGSLGYKLHVPNVPTGRKRALVLMLHGCTQDPDDFACGTGMNALADEFGLVVAYPHQPRSANAQGCWNWFDVRHQKRGFGEPAVLAGMAEALAKEFAIDCDRVYVAGLSAGGAMAEVLSATYPDVFAAVGVHSGLPYGAASDVMTAFAAMKGNAKAATAHSATRNRKIVFHGSADVTVHPSNGERVFNAARGSNTGLQELTSHLRTSGKSVVRTVIAPSSGRAVAELWQIEGGGHAWSGGNPAGSFADADGPDASREMIRFFLEDE